MPVDFVGKRVKSDVDKDSTILDPSINTGTIIMAKTKYSYEVVGKMVPASPSTGNAYISCAWHTHIIPLNNFDSAEEIDKYCQFGC